MTAETLTPHAKTQGQARAGLHARPLDVDAVAFDLLTALVDSWALWESVAGHAPLGRSWRQASLRLVTAAGSYQPYEDMERQAAGEVGVPVARADDLLRRWPEIRPWPEAPGVWPNWPVDGSPASPTARSRWP
jgi:hypothetical protein